ncbi:MAG: GNAT family N-acetyltransferase [Erysipelotrichaceae bacterium]
MMHIRTSTLADLPAIVALIEEAKAFLYQHRVDQWQNGYPNMDVIRGDIQAKTSYVVEMDGDIVASFFLSFDIDPTYAVVHGGAWQGDDPYAVIHRYVIANRAKASGISHRIMVDIKQLCTQEEIHEIRIDTHEDNRIMQGMLLREGFQKVGTIHLATQETRLAFQCKW